MSYPTLFDDETKRRAARALARRDGALREVLRRHGPISLPRRSPGGAFAFLVRTVVYQQLAISAAAAIHARLVERVAGGDGRLSAEAILSAGEPALRSAGLSSGKARTVAGLAEKVASGELVTRTLSRHPDDEVRSRIVALKGFGPWSADIFLLFHLGRTDVFPCGDLGLRHAAADIYGGDSPWPERDLEEQAASWRPYRSAAAWLLWRHRSGRRPGLGDKG